MVRAFEELTHKYSGLQLTLLGGVAPKRSSVNYLRKVSERVGSKNVSVRPDASRKSVMSEVRRSNLYWHAAGLGVGNDEPWRMEHFGIAPVEACQMGVLPLVPDNGGVGANLRQLSDICVYRDINELVAKTSAIIDGTIAPLSEEEIKDYFTVAPPQSCSDLQVYLRHLRNADEQLGRLRNALRARSRPYILVFYGEHLPSMPGVYDTLGFPDGRTDYFVDSTAGAEQQVVDLEIAELPRRILGLIR